MNVAYKPKEHYTQNTNTMRLLNIALILLISQLAFAQQSGNTQVKGTISGAKWKKISLKIDRSHKGYEQQIYNVQLNENNEFVFVIPLDKPQVVALSYGANGHARIYLEPGDDLKIDCQAANFQRSMYFSGIGGVNNQMFKSYHERYPEVSKFKTKQYKQGTLYYEIPTAIDAKMQLRSPYSFTSEMKRYKQERISMIESYARSFPGLSPMFIKQMTANATYEWAHYMLVYGYVFGEKKAIEPAYFDFMHEVVISDDELVGNAKYRRYVQGYINYQFDNSGKEDDPYVGQYKVAKDMLYGETQAFAQSESIRRGLDKNELYVMLDVYHDFVSTTQYEDYTNSTTDLFYKKNRYAVGSQAPAFTMKDINGNPVSLHDYADKVIYIDFWATWCRPCVSKIEMTKTVQSRLNRIDVVFIHVSLEKSEERWRQSVGFRNLDGIHLYAEGGMDSDIVASYNVKTIPEYFIIDKNGSFARKPEQTDALSLKSFLETME